jgi:hypothetical protein
MPLRLSWHSVGERGLDRRTRVQRSQHDNRGDCGASKFGRDIRGDTGEAQHLDVQHFSSCTRRFEILAAVVPQTEVGTGLAKALYLHVSSEAATAPTATRSDRINFFDDDHRNAPARCTIDRRRGGLLVRDCARRARPWQKPLKYDTWSRPIAHWGERRC